MVTSHMGSLGHDLPFPRALSLRVMILPVSVPGENAEGGGRMRGTRLVLR